MRANRYPIVALAALAAALLAPREAEAGIAECGQFCSRFSDCRNPLTCAWDFRCGGMPGAACLYDSDCEDCPTGPLPNNKGGCVSGRCCKVKCGAACCGAGQTCCGTAGCRDLLTDINNCGACGRVCNTVVPNGSVACVSGGCAITCDPGYTLCSGKCVKLDTNTDCGACGNVCASGTTCTTPLDGLTKPRCECNSTVCPLPRCCSKNSPLIDYDNVCVRGAWHPSGVTDYCPDCEVAGGCGLPGSGDYCGFQGETMSQVGGNVEFRLTDLPANVRILNQDNNAFLYDVVRVIYNGPYTVRVRAKADTGLPEGCGAQPAQLRVIVVNSLGVEMLSEKVEVKTADWAEFDLSATLPVDTYRIDLHYEPDCYDAATGDDRNVYIDWVAVIAGAVDATYIKACGGQCVDVRVDPDNCGACGNACGDGKACVAGACISNVCLAAVPGGIKNEVALSPTNDVACRLHASSLAQSVVDHQKGEDQSFFVQETTVPAMLVLVDNGVTMRRLPQDPGCSAVVPTGAQGTCNSALIDGYFDVALHGATKPDPDFPNLFNPDLFYVGLGDDVNVRAGCDDVTVAPMTAAQACSYWMPTGTATDLAACTSCLTGTGAKGYYLLNGNKRIWSGRFLNYYPPKCVLARNLAKSPTLVGQTLVRYSLAQTIPTSGTKIEAAIDFAQSGFQPNQCIKGALTEADTKPSSSYLGKVNGAGGYFSFDNPSKPLAEALFNAGEFLTDYSRPYELAFGVKWTNNAFRTQIYDGPDATNTHVSVCSGCQKSAIVLLTDGKPCQDNYLPKDMAPLSKYNPWDATALKCKAGYEGCTDWCKPTEANWAASVAEGLNLEDLRTDHAGQQGATTYVIAVGTDNPLLRSVARKGGGEYFTAYTGAQLEQALHDIIQTVSGRSMSVSAPSVSTLQTKTGTTALVPRFTPSRAAFWEGELFKFRMVSEFALDCVKPGKRRQTNGTIVDDARCICRGSTEERPKCEGLYTFDADNKLVGVDPDDGQMVRADPNVWDSATEYFQLLSPRVPAKPVWAAGDLIEAKGPANRKVYTVLDNPASPDGKITSADPLVSLDPSATDLQIDRLIPYLGLGTNSLAPGDTTNVCDRIAARLKDGGIFLPHFNERTCARIVIAFIRGFDTFNETGKVNVAEYNPGDNTLPQRRAILGDIFHSSPVRVDPPIPKMPLCDRGFHNQCLRSLYATATPADNALTGPATCGITDSAVLGKSDAYNRYVRQQTFIKKRPSVVLVGANDGMLHAFQLNCFAKETNGLAEYYEDAGDSGCAAVSGLQNNGDELWAFVPPDQLPKLAELLVGVRHPYFVDGTPMVRDIWIDLNADGKKRCDEYRTIAIVGERRGGTRYFALDVTNPLTPVFRWLFPQVGSPDELAMGETWSDYLPGAPPIGPVKLKTDTSFAERWVVMLGGGFDPRQIRGNRLYMLDAWTGRKVWDAKLTSEGPTASMKYPIAAMPALVAWGNSDKNANADFNGQFFDTAIVGDLGGQVWVARFHEPGVFTSNEYGEAVVGNWHVARAFEEARDGNALSRPPFYSMAAAVRMPTTGALRAYLGAGDRYNLRQTDLGRCTVDDPLACARGGLNFATATGRLDMSTTPPTAVASPYAMDSDRLSVSWSLSSTGAVTRTESLVYNPDVSCASKASPISVGATTTIATDKMFDSGLACTTSSGKMSCAGDVTDRGLIFTGLDAASTESRLNANPDWFNRFLSFQVFRASPFATATAASLFDTNRLTESDLKQLTPFATTQVPLASESDLGWYFYFPGIDERTATNTTIFNGCVLWSTVQASPPCSTDADCGAGGNCVGGGCYMAYDPCGSATGSVSAFLYQANAITGGPSCALTANPTQRTMTKVLVPPPPPQEVVQVNTYGQYKTTIAAPPGTTPPPPSTATFSLMQSFSTVEVPKTVHECRHRTPGGTPAPVCK